MKKQNANRCASMKTIKATKSPHFGRFAQRITSLFCTTIGIMALCVTDEIRGGELERGELKYENQTRSYSVYMPDGYTGEAAFPLVINMHGGLGDGTGAVPTPRRPSPRRPSVIPRRPQRTFSNHPRRTRLTPIAQKPHKLTS